MSPRLARDVILQEEFDSGSLTPLCCLVHFIKKPGLYIGQVSHGKDVVATFRVQAVEEGAPHQLTLDLAMLRGMQTEARLMRAPGGIVFHSSFGAIGYSVKMWGADGPRRRLEFDSRKLGDDDMFTVTLLQPGDYEVVAEGSKPLARLQVGECKPGKKPYRPPAAAVAGLSARGIADAGGETMSLRPAQTQVFRPEGRRRIVVRLTGTPEAAADTAPKKVVWPRQDE